MTLNCSGRQRPRLQRGQGRVFLFCWTPSAQTVLHLGKDTLGQPQWASVCQALSRVFSYAISVHRQNICHLRKVKKSSGWVKSGLGATRQEFKQKAV